MTENLFEHLGLLYHDTGEYLAGTTAFVREALAVGNPVLVAVPGANLDLIRDALGDDGTAVAFEDMAVAGRNPGRIIPGMLLDFADRHPGRRVAVIGEPIWPGRSLAEYPVCATHEALINTAFVGRDAAILCPYDVRGLDATRVADAHRTHPVLVERAERRMSTAYTDPVQTAAAFNLPLPRPPASAVWLSYRDKFALAEIRRFVVERARAAGLSRDRVDDLAISVNELATNTAEHTGDGGRVSIWTERDVVICQVEDTGHITNPMAGRLPVPPTDIGGRGLLMVNQICDLVRVHTEPGRTTIRLHISG